MGLKSKPLQQEVDEARPLAEFANLEESRVNEFRKDHPNFVPDSWWSYQSDAAANAGFSRHWQWCQKILQGVWKSEFSYLPQIDLMRLLLSIFDPKNLSGFSTKGNLFTIDISLPGQRPAFVDMMDMDEQLYPCQEAVLFLKDHPRLAKWCPCGNFFVANATSAKYCSTQGETACQEALDKIKETRNATLTRNSAKYNSQRRRKYHKEHPKARFRKRTAKSITPS